MLDYDVHLSDEELILAADGELPTKRAARVKSHMAACWTCRTRMKQIEETIAVVVQLLHEDLDPQVPPGAGPRALLKARLERLADEPGPSAIQSFFQAVARNRLPVFLAAAICVVAIGTVVVWHDAAVSRDDTLTERVELNSLPNRTFTPGATRPVAISDVCSMEHEETIRAVPADTQAEVFQEYGLRSPRTQDYEVDYLITPGLGGADQLGNLWPEPYSTTWNAHVKDDLEEHLHEMVCEKKLALATAQHDIATNWITAYKKYFRSNRPVQSTASLASHTTDEAANEAWEMATTEHWALWQRPRDFLLP